MGAWVRVKIALWVAWWWAVAAWWGIVAQPVAFVAGVTVWWVTHVWLLDIKPEWEEFKCSKFAVKWKSKFSA
jgi:fatty acid desaturase